MNNYDPQFNETRVVNEAVRKANPGGGSRYSGAGKSVSMAPPGGFTTAITDGDDILDGHDALWDLDEWDDTAAFWAP